MGGCAGSPRGKMLIVQSPTEFELKENWGNYTVYYRPRLAFIYKLLDNREIILDNKWVPVSTGEMMAKSNFYNIFELGAIYRYKKWLIGCSQRGPCLQDDTLGLDYAEGQPGGLNSVIAEIEKV